MIIEAHVKPGSKTQSLELDGNILKISVKSKAEDNAANREVLKLVKDRLGDCTIVKGHNSRKKLISLHIDDIFEIRRILTQD